MDRTLTVVCVDATDLKAMARLMSWYTGNIVMTNTMCNKCYNMHSCHSC